MSNIEPTEEQKQAAYELCKQSTFVYANDGVVFRAMLNVTDISRLLAEREAKLQWDYWGKTSELVDNVVYYRNLAIVLGAKPQQMVNEYDRKLCSDGIDPNDTGDGYHMSVAEVIEGKEEDFDEMQSLKSKVTELEEKIKGAAFSCPSCGRHDYGLWSPSNPGEPGPQAKDHRVSGDS